MRNWISCFVRIRWIFISWRIVCWKILRCGIVRWKIICQLIGCRLLFSITSFLTHCHIKGMKGIRWRVISGHPNKYFSFSRFTRLWTRRSIKTRPNCGEAPGSLSLSLVSDQIEESTWANEPPRVPNLWNKCFSIPIYISIIYKHNWERKTYQFKSQPKPISFIGTRRCCKSSKESH